MFRTAMIVGLGAMLALPPQARAQQVEEESPNGAPLVGALVGGLIGGAIGAAVSRRAPRGGGFVPAGGGASPGGMKPGGGGHKGAPGGVPMHRKPGK